MKLSPDTYISPIKQFQHKIFLFASKELDVIVYQIHLDKQVEEHLRFSMSQVNKIKMDHKTTFILFNDFIVMSDANFPITFVSREGKILKTIDPQDFQNKRENALCKKWIEYHFEQNGYQYVIWDKNPYLYRIDPKKRVGFGQKRSFNFTK